MLQICYIRLSADAFLLALPGNSRALFARRVDMSEESPK